MLIKAKPVTPKSIRTSVRVVVLLLLKYILSTKYYPSSEASLTLASIDTTISFRDSRFSSTLGLSACSRTTLFPPPRSSLLELPYFLLNSLGFSGNYAQSALAFRSIYRLLF